eukprot:tig00020556_g11002.t1
MEPAAPKLIPCPTRYGFGAPAAPPPKESELLARMRQLVPGKLEEVKQIKTRFGDEVVDKVTLEQIYGGARAIKCMIWEGSLLDAEEGIRFRGLSIPEVQKALPKAAGGEEPLPEALWWFLLTGEIPTPEQTASITAEWHARSKLPESVVSLLASLPHEMHPMTKLSMGLMGLQPQSLFARKYQAGMKKTEYWAATFEDAMTLLGQITQVAAHIYRHQYCGGVIIPPDPTLDWAANFAHMLGFDDPEFYELMRLYLVLHADHEGGNVSAHTVHLVGSALSDAFLCVSAGMNGLAGPLHGLANQEVLTHLNKIQAELNGAEPTVEVLTKMVWEHLNKGRVIPGYGHAVLRNTDPRYKCQREFALKHLPEDPLFKLVSTMYEVVPKVLMEQGKVRNPWPNVDAHSGVLLVHYGFVHQNFYTVLFGVSRAIGTLAQLVWDQAMAMPLERPKSITTEWVKAWLAKQGKTLDKEPAAAEAHAQVHGHSLHKSATLPAFVNHNAAALAAEAASAHGPAPPDAPADAAARATAAHQVAAA